MKIISNPDYRSGMSTSIAAGLSLVNATVDIMIVLADQPFVESEAIDSLIAAFETHDTGIVIPTYRGVRGHPVIFATKYRNELLGLRGDTGGREVIRSHNEDILAVPVTCAGIHIDLDTIADYKKCREGGVSSHAG